MAAPYSGLEVVPPEQAGLEHNPPQFQQHQQYYEPVKTDSPPYDEQYNGAPAQQKDGRICGLSRNAFWIVLAVVGIIVVAAAIGGGVGGSLASKNSTNANTSSSGASSAQAATTTTSGGTSTSPRTGPITPSPTATPALSYTTIVSSTQTLIRDCPSSNNTLYQISLGGNAQNFRKVCDANYLNAIAGGDVVNVRTTNLNDCINLCAAYNVQNASAIRKGTNNVCNAVCWRSSFVNDDFPGQCFGFTTQNSSSAFVVQPDPICDSAAWIDQKFL